MDYKYLESAAEINEYTESLKKNGKHTIALDFEGEFNLHAYGERLCLVQIFDTEDAVLIDPMKADMQALKQFLEDEKILKIMWDAQSDISLVVNGYSMTIKSVLDLRPAADLLELSKRDYASVTSKLLGIKKKEGKSMFQKYNWLRRPIDSAAIDYALNDVIYLHELRDVVFQKLYDKNMLNEFFRLNMIIQNRNYLRMPGQRHKKMKGYRYLNSNEKARLKKLFEIRDGFARKMDWPPHRLIANPDLLDLAKGVIHPSSVRFDRKLGPEIRNDILRDLKDFI